MRGIRQPRFPSGHQLFKTYCHNIFPKFQSLRLRGVDEGERILTKKGSLSNDHRIVSLTKNAHGLLNNNNVQMLLNTLFQFYYKLGNRNDLQFFSQMIKKKLLIISVAQLIIKLKIITTEYGI